MRARLISGHVEIVWRKNLDNNKTEKYIIETLTQTYPGDNTMIL